MKNVQKLQTKKCSKLLQRTQLTKVERIQQYVIAIRIQNKTKSGKNKTNKSREILNQKVHFPEQFKNTHNKKIVPIIEAEIILKSKLLSLTSNHSNPNSCDTSSNLSKAFVRSDSVNEASIANYQRSCPNKMDQELDQKCCSEGLLEDDLCGSVTHSSIHPMKQFIKLAHLRLVLSSKISVNSC